MNNDTDSVSKCKHRFCTARQALFRLHILFGENKYLDYATYFTQSFDIVKTLYIIMAHMSCKYILKVTIYLNLFHLYCK